MPRLVDRVQASREARERTKIVLLTLAGHWTVKDALALLGIGRTRFQDLRRALLEAAVAALEPGVAGRPARARRKAERELRDLRAEVAAMTQELRILRAQVDLHERGLGDKMPRRLELAGGVR
jgi:hypothetical protein